MFTVYVLQNSLNGKYYIGSTQDIERRLIEHNRGQTKSTRYGKHLWNLVYKEFYRDKKQAMKRERTIKRYKGGNAFKKLIEAAVVQW